MAKGDRSRSNKKAEPTNITPRQKAMSKINKKDAMPLQQNEALVVQEWIDQSNQYGKLMQQFEQYEFTLQNIIWKRKQIQKGEIKINAENPVMIPLVGKAFCQVTDKKQVLKDLDDQIKSLTNARDGIKGQMLHRRDEYIESALRVITFMKERYGKYSSKNIDVGKYHTGARVKAGKKETKKNQEKIFEAEFNEIMKDAAKQAEFKEACKKAEKHNEELKKKE